MAQALRFSGQDLEETIVKHALLVGAVILGLANTASAQITDVHTRCGENGSHFILGALTETFNYEATVCGNTVAYAVTLDVYHNGVLKSTTTDLQLLPPPSYLFSASVNMSSWGLRAGDSVTFRLRVLSVTLGNLLASHTLIGDVVPAGAPKTEGTTEP